MGGLFLDRQGIEGIIPHRDPFLFLDEVWISEPDQKAWGRKCLTGSEPFFAGHFPGKPIMPGVLIIEAIAQTGACLLRFRPTRDGERTKLAVLHGKEFRIIRPVFPGSTLCTEFEVQGLRTIHNREVGFASGRAYVADDVDDSVVEVKLNFSLVEQDEFFVQSQPMAATPA